MILVERHWNRALGVLLATTTLLGGCGAGGGSAGGGGEQPTPGGGSTGGDPAGADAGGGSATGSGGSATGSGGSATGSGGTTGGATGGGSATGGGGGANGGASGAGGAGAGGGVVPGEPDCLDNDTFFVRKVWRETLRPVCSTCHSANGVAANTRMVFVPEGAPEWQLRNLQAFEGVATLQMDGVPLVLLKPSGEVAHGGGAVLTADAPGRPAFEEMIARLADPEAHACAATAGAPTTWAGVESLSPAETLRKTTLFFGSRLPTDAEIALVDTNGLAGLEPALDAVLHEDAFYEWLRWATNDLLLTDKFLGSRRAVDAIDDDRYPEARWYLQEGVDPGTGLDATWFRAAQTFTNDTLAREPVELVVHLLRNDRPITEMLTADYTVVNPFSARAYGLQDTVQFEDRFDPRVFVEARLPGIPHAGVLTTPIFMTRYPTTATNRNRARARVVYNSFLATNVLELAQRPISAVSPIHNPTLNDPQCNVCHSVIDPVAGALQNWNARGGYEVLDAWYPEMTPPGFGEEMLPQEARTEGASWLAQRIVADRRFDRAIVRWMFKAIVGSAVRSDPGAPPPGMEEDPVFLARVAAFEAQTDALTRLERELRANGHDLRVLIKSIVRSPWFRAERAVDPTSVPPAAALPDVGVGRILAPEHLSRRIQAITGLPWRPRADAVDYLLDVSQYKLLYGGLDSEDVTERTAEPNALMAAIQTRMATDMACLLVTQEFARAPELRRLFTGVEPSFRPLDTNGFEVPQARVAIRATLQRLHWALLGERLADDAPQLDQTWALFNDTWTEVTAALASGELSANLQDNCRATRDYRTGVDLPQERRITQDPNGTIRAWQAVVQALLSDFRFLHE